MKNKIAFFIASCLLCTQPIAAQKTNLYIPINVQRAVERGTRSIKGKPGSKYFQNKVNYQIKADFDPRKGILKGSELASLQNNSPDSLNYIVIRLYQNIYKSNIMRQVIVDSSDVNNAGVDIKSISINGTNIPHGKLRFYQTNMIVPLPSKLNPNSSLKMNVNWEVKLPNKTQLRMGRYDSTSYFVGYWYPQFAVYDDINGWNTEPYTGLYEFYNEYGNFDVSITLPKGFVIWATGELQNSKEIFTDEINNRIEKAKNIDDVVKIITPFDYYNNKVLRTNTENTWHFIAKNVSDFAFGASNHYIWDGTSVEVDSSTHRRAMANHVYKIDSNNGEGVAAIARETILRLSTDLIGVPYPYPHNTIWEGNDGMEFPMMCNDGPSETLFSKVFVTSHEVSHSYFPFMVGTNETLYGWIDEGLVTFIPKKIEIDAGNNNAHYYINAYSKRSMGTINDIPLSVPTTSFTPNTYFMQLYGRAATGFYFLHDILGDKLFAEVLRNFIYNWESRHPTPTDLALTFNKVTDQDWSWYWNAWFYENGYADLSIEKADMNKSDLDIIIDKKGKYPVPIKLIITFKDNSIKTIYKSADIWKNNDRWTFTAKFDKPIAKIEVGDKNIPDINLNDNVLIIK